MSDINSWNTTDASNNASPPDGFPENMAYSAVNNAARAVMGGVKRWFADLGGSLAGGGSADAYTVTLNQGYSAYFDGLTFACSIPAANATTTPTINVNSIGAQTIVDAAGAALEVGELMTGGVYLFSYDGTNMRVLNSLKDTFNKGADIASATALSPGSDGNYFDVTGTTTITSIDSVRVGTVIKLHFDAALTLTHHATNLILPGGVNIVTEAGDEAEFVEYASGDWRCTSYQRNQAVLTSGSWTPALWDDSNSSSESQTYSTQTGTYVRIGNLVFIRGELNVTSSGTLTASEQMSIGDLPFNPANAAPINVGLITGNTQQDSGTRYTGLMNTSGNKIDIYYNGDSSSDQALPISSGLVNFNEGRIVFSGCYEI